MGKFQVTTNGNGASATSKNAHNADAQSAPKVLYTWWNS